MLLHQIIIAHLEEGNMLAQDSGDEYRNIPLQYFIISWGYSATDRKSVMPELSGVSSDRLTKSTLFSTAYRWK